MDFIKKIVILLVKSAVLLESTANEQLDLVESTQRFLQ